MIVENRTSRQWFQLLVMELSHWSPGVRPGRVSFLSSFHLGFLF
jgi:hypothetical protein